jgi:hypothetical protein
LNTRAVTLLEKPAPVKTRCFKVLYKMSWSDVPMAPTERHPVANPEIWSRLLARMAIATKTAEEREEQRFAWGAFKNALFYQPHFVAFLLMSPELSVLLGDCFSSIQESVLGRMSALLPLLTRAALARTTDLECHQNIADLWMKLRDPAVLFAGKLRSAIREAHSDGRRAAVIQFVFDLGEAFALKRTANKSPGVAPLIDFMMTKQINEELRVIVTDVSKIYPARTTLKTLLRGLIEAKSTKL